MIPPKFLRILYRLKKNLVIQNLILVSGITLGIKLLGFVKGNGYSCEFWTI